MNDLLLITDMARLSRFFERLADDNKFILRVVNNLVKGGEEIAIKKPDVVFVQTQLSGLSAEISLMHLKKQLGRKRTRFVLLATPGQVSSDILKSYQGWLDISCKEKELTLATTKLLTSFFSKAKKAQSPVEENDVKDGAAAEEKPIAAAAPAFLNRDFAETTAAVIPAAADEPAVTPPPSASAPKDHLEDQQITYSPRPRLSVYSEFNSSFDNAVNSIREPEAMKESEPALEHNWSASRSERVTTIAPQSKISTFLLWLAPVIVIVVIVTYLQMNSSAPTPVTVTATPSVSTQSPAKTAAPPVAVTAPNPRQDKLSSAAKPALDTVAIDKAVTAAAPKVQETRSTPASSGVNTGGRLSVLPDFIPRYGADKQYGKANPGWERYKGQVTEFKIFREEQTIKAIQVIDRGGRGVPESFMKGVLRQVAKKPRFSVEASEKKDGYEISRGSVSDNLSVVYYRDEQGGRLRAFVMTWK